MKENKRIQWLDIARGILIVLMVVGHTYSPVNAQIYLFHIPAFFFTSGYVSNYDKDWRKLVKKAVVFRLGVFFSINLLLVFGSFFLERFLPDFFLPNARPLSQQIINLFLYGYTPELGGATWFLEALFFCELCAILCRSIGKHLAKWLEFVLTAVIVAAGYIISQDPSIVKHHNIDLGMIALLYYQIGAWARRYEWEEKIDKVPALAISGSFFLFFAIWWQNFQNWPTRFFDHFSVSIMCSLTGIYILCIASRLMENTGFGKVFQCIGNRSFSIMCCHFLAFRILSMLLFSLGLISKGEVSAFPTPGSYWAIYVIGSVSICLLISRLAGRWKVSNYIFNARWN